MIPIQFPSSEKLQPMLERLEADPAGVLLLAVTCDPDTRNYFNVQMAFLDGTERRELKAGLTRAKSKRLSKIPQSTKQPVEGGSLN